MYNLGFVGIVLPILYVYMQSVMRYNYSDPTMLPVCKGCYIHPTHAGRFRSRYVAVLCRKLSHDQFPVMSGGANSVAMYEELYNGIKNFLQICFL